MLVKNRLTPGIKRPPAAVLLAAAAHMAACSVVVPPEPGDWTAHGLIVNAGRAGDWDNSFHPGIHIPATAIRNGEDILLYYVAADGDRESDGGPKRRSLGLAASSDGLKYSKHAHNPVVTYFPTPQGCNAEEEGIWRPTVALHGGSSVIL